MRSEILMWSSLLSYDSKSLAIFHAHFSARLRVKLAANPLIHPLLPIPLYIPVLSMALVVVVTAAVAAVAWFVRLCIYVLLIRHVPYDRPLAM
jgi:ABC-type transport system involved in cytochrome c biogenesis permease component